MTIILGWIEASSHVEVGGIRTGKALVCMVHFTQVSAPLKQVGVQRVNKSSSE